MNATSGGNSASTEFYAGAGDDFISAMNGQNITIYADASASDTAGGNDSLTLNNITSSTIYGAAGGDTLMVTGGSTNRIDVGGGTNYVTGTAGYVSSTLLAGSGSDTLFLYSSTTGYVDAGAGADSVAIEYALGTNTTTKTTNHVGTGADTLTLCATEQYATILGGTDAANQITFDSTIDQSTVRGGTGADTHCYWQGNILCSQPVLTSLPSPRA